MNKQAKGSIMVPTIVTLLLIFAVAGNVCAQKPCVPPTTGLVSWWPGDGNADDKMNNNQGTEQNGTGYEPGKVQQAFSFDGIDDFVETTDIGLPLGSAPRTLGLWVKHAYNAWIPFIYGNFEGYDAYYIIVMGPNVCIGQYGGQPQEPCGETDVTDGEWHHLALTYDGARAMLYVDGVVEATQEKVYATTSTGRAYIGGTVGGSEEYVSGLVDEVLVYNRALSMDEIRAIMCKGHEGTIGTQITITGSDFGTKKGKVTVGGKSCKVSEWVTDSIACDIKAKLPPGSYDVVVQLKEPKNTEPIVYEKVFTMMTPEIQFVDPGFAPTHVIEVSGIYFGTKKGKVYLVDPASGRRKICRITEVEGYYGQEIDVGQKPCRVKEWTMNPATGESTIVFTVFKNLRAGTYGVEVVNKVGKANALFTVN